MALSERCIVGVLTFWLQQKAGELGFTHLLCGFTAVGLFGAVRLYCSNKTRVNVNRYKNDMSK